MNKYDRILERLHFVFDTDWSSSWWVIGGAVLALLANAGLLSAGALLERRQEKRLATIGPGPAGVLLLVGQPPEGLPTRGGVPLLLCAAIVTAQPVLGRLSSRLRRWIGGRDINRQREVERARREVLLRLREQAAAQGATILAGVEITHLALGRGRTAVTASGTALLPAAGDIVPDSHPQGRVTEAAGGLPARPISQVLLALAILALLAVSADWINDNMMSLGEWLYRVTS